MLVDLWWGNVREWFGSESLEDGQSRRSGANARWFEGMEEWHLVKECWKTCTNFGRHVASLACHLALINTPFTAYLAHPLRPHLLYYMFGRRPQWHLKGLILRFQNEDNTNWLWNLQYWFHILILFKLLCLLWIEFRMHHLRNLTPEGPRGVFLQKRSKSTISSLRSSNEILFTFLHF
jgi:hypothetical protein